MMKKMLAYCCIFFGIIIGCTTKNKTQKNDAIVVQYACIPCGYDCDKATYDKPGTCSSCKMDLVKKETIVHNNISIDSLCFLADSNTVFLDVRTIEEFKGTAPDKFGAIKNAVNIPVQELEKRKTELDKFKDKNIVVYCSHAHRSAIASYQLTQNGFTRVNNMLGGMSVWKEKMKTSLCNTKLYLAQ
jgi:rhodanese-related sulfurtransferase